METVLVLVVGLALVGGVLVVLTNLLDIWR